MEGKSFSDEVEKFTQERQEIIAEKIRKMEGLHPKEELLHVEGFKKLVKYAETPYERGFWLGVLGSKLDIPKL